MRILKTILAVMVTALFVNAQDLTAEQKAKVDAKLKLFSVWGTDAKVVEAVKAFNANPPAAAKEMTQDKWKTLTLISPEIKAFTKHELAVYLKTKKDESVSEMFISGANGTKVAFFAKTSSWSHLGKPKHDVPMTGKTWIGKVEVDESTGMQQVQVAFPVLDGGKAIGSIVVGLSLSKL